MILAGRSFYSDIRQHIVYTDSLRNREFVQSCIECSINNRDSYEGSLIVDADPELPITILGCK